MLKIYISSISISKNDNHMDNPQKNETSSLPQVSIRSKSLKRAQIKYNQSPKGKERFKRYHLKHPEVGLRASSKCKVKLRNQVIEYKGDKCQNCFDTDVFDIAHPSNDGKKDRMEHTQYTILKLILAGERDVLLLCPSCHDKFDVWYKLQFTTLDVLRANNFFIDKLKPDKMHNTANDGTPSKMKPLWQHIIESLTIYSNRTQ